MADSAPSLSELRHLAQQHKKMGSLYVDKISMGALGLRQVCTIQLLSPSCLVIPCRSPCPGSGMAALRTRRLSVKVHSKSLSLHALHGGSVLMMQAVFRVRQKSHDRGLRLRGRTRCGAVEVAVSRRAELSVYGLLLGERFAAGPRPRNSCQSGERKPCDCMMDLHYTLSKKPCI